MVKEFGMEKWNKVYVSKWYEMIKGVKEEV